MVVMSNHFPSQEKSLMKDRADPPAETPDPKAFERMTELTRRLVAVPKSELPKPKPVKRKKN